MPRARTIVPKQTSRKAIDIMTAIAILLSKAIPTAVSQRPVEVSSQFKIRDATVRSPGRIPAPIGPPLLRLRQFLAIILETLQPGLRPSQGRELQHPCFHPPQYCRHTA